MILSYVSHRFETWSLAWGEHRGVTAVTFQLDWTATQHKKNTMFGRTVLSVGCYCWPDIGCMEYMQKFDRERLRRSSMWWNGIETVLERL